MFYKAIYGCILDDFPGAVPACGWAIHIRMSLFLQLSRGQLA